MAYSQKYRKYADLTPDKLQDMTSKELTRALSAITKEVNRRGKVWANQKTIPQIPGLKGISDRITKSDGKQKFQNYKSSQYTTKKQKIREISKLQQILERKTSTVTGYKRAKRERRGGLEEKLRIATGQDDLELTPAQSKKFGKLLKRLEENHYIRSKAVGDYYSKGSPEAFKLAYSIFTANKKMDIDEIFDEFEERYIAQEEEITRTRKMEEDILMSL